MFVVKLQAECVCLLLSCRLSVFVIELQVSVCACR